MAMRAPQQFSTDPQQEPVDPFVERRAQLRSRHSQALARLMEEREDLRGVHALADFVSDSLRWSA